MQWRIYRTHTKMPVTNITVHKKKKKTRARGKMKVCLYDHLHAAFRYARMLSLWIRSQQIARMLRNKLFALLPLLTDWWVSNKARIKDTHSKSLTAHCSNNFTRHKTSHSDLQTCLFLYSTKCAIWGKKLLPIQCATKEKCNWGLRKWACIFNKRTPFAN